MEIGKWRKLDFRNDAFVKDCHRMEIRTGILTLTVQIRLVIWSSYWEAKIYLDYPIDLLIPQAIEEELEYAKVCAAISACQYVNKLLTT